MPTRQATIGRRTVLLDARPDRLDLRDRPYQPPLGNLPGEWPPQAFIEKYLPEYAKRRLVLDQGSEGACTGFGLAAVINFLLFAEGVRSDRVPDHAVSPAMLYQLARLYDEWPGEDYEGSSCRGALKGWHRHGVCRETLWPFRTSRAGRRVPVKPVEDPKAPGDPDRNWDVDALSRTLGVYYRVDVRSVVDLQAAIHQNGAVYVAATVHEGWGVPTKKDPHGHADLVRIEPVARPAQPGGHAFALVGYNAQGFVVQNSWGPGWGSHGFALLPYEDWVQHAADAWVFTMGVSCQPKGLARDAAGAADAAGVAGVAEASGPARATRSARAALAANAMPSRPARSPRFLVPFSGTGMGAVPDRPGGLIGADDDLARRYRDVRDPAHRPLDADLAYRHTLVLDRGFPVRNDITAENAQDALASTVLARPAAWLRDHGSAKVMIYAHGGLNGEGTSITRARILAPYALAHGIYPIFVAWRSGPMETVGDLVEEWAAKLGLTVRGDERGARGPEPARGWLDRVADGVDRMLEPVLRAPGGALWGQMKQNAVRASDDAQGGLRLAVESLERLREAVPRLEIHLVGHSAGSIVLGAMLDQLGAAGLKAASVRLFAPACTARFALDHYVPAVKKRVVRSEHFHIHALTDRNELDDSVGPYRKSLLYLVSRSFEDVHKTPLLGMANCFDPKTVEPRAADGTWSRDRIDEVKRWQSFWSALGREGSNLHLLSARNVSTGAGTARASHGCFDNAVDIVGQTLGYIVNSTAPATVRVERLDY